MFAGVPIRDVRDYWDRQPCNVRHSSKPVGSREYFDEVEARRYFVEPHIPAFAQFNRWARKRVLEVGCGIGTDTIAFARAGAKVTAVDLSEESLRLVAKRAHVYGVEDRVTLVRANAERLVDEVPPKPYDLVYSFGVIHHTPHPDAVLHQIRSHYVSDHTTLKLMLYHRYSWKVLAILARDGHGTFWKLDDLVAQHSEAQTGCPITYTFSRSQARRMLHRHGFQAEELHINMIFPYRIPDYVADRYVKEWYFRYMPSSLFRALERAVGWHLCITARPASWFIPAK
jgi:SAM-dependent methyltransferase